ncbi:jg9158, partial [Pararge aegeria aegeria]
MRGSGALRHFISLATRGTCMDTHMSNLLPSTSGGSDQEQRSKTDSAPTGIFQELKTSIDSATTGAPSVLDRDVTMEDGGHTTSAQPSSKPAQPDNKNIYANPAFRRLSGAGKKRMWRLLKEGLELNEAILQAGKPCSTQPNGPRHNLKRGRPEDNSPKEKPSKAPKLSTTPVRRGTNPPLSYRDIAGATRVGIQNVVPMTDAQMSSVRAALVTFLNTKGRCMDNRGAGPSFLGFTHKAGWILVTCENQRSKDWLVSELPNCKPWPEANLSIMEDSELPKPWIATTLIPATDASSVSEALDTIRYQNEGLYPEHWRVLNEKVDGAGIIAAISLDEISVETLRARDFRVNIGFRKIVFRVRGANTGSASGAAAEVHTNPATAAPGSTGLGVGSAGLSTSPAPPAPGPSGLGG